MRSSDQMKYLIQLNYELHELYLNHNLPICSKNNFILYDTYLILSY